MLSLLALSTFENADWSEILSFTTVTMGVLMVATGLGVAAFLLSMLLSALGFDNYPLMAGGCLTAAGGMFLIVVLSAIFM